MKKRDIFFIVLTSLLIVVFLFPIEKNLGLSLDKYLFLLFVLLPVAALLGFYGLYILTKKIPVLWQFGKFVEVGVLNTLVDWGVLNFLVLISGVASGIAFSFFKSISFLVALFNSYIFNKFWTFEKSSVKRAGKEFLEFVFAALPGWLEIFYVVSSGIYIFTSTIHDTIS